MVRNVHHRQFRATEEALGALLDQLAGPNDPLWPSGWPPLRLDGPLGVGADGGHGPIRYRVTAYEPGRRVVFEFRSPTPLRGWHSLRVEPGATAGTAVLRHELVGRPLGTGILRWPLCVRWLHDALIEELLDRAGHAVGDPPPVPARRSAWVRLWLVLLGPLLKAPAGELAKPPPTRSV